MQPEEEKPKPKISEEEKTQQIYEKYGANVFQANLSINVNQAIQNEKMIERYNKYSLYVTRRYLNNFQNRNKAWSRMNTSLLAYDYNLVNGDVTLQLCDKFMQGAYLPNEKKIILCSNTLTKQNDFDNALTRHLVKLYDHVRSENYNFDNCKHLACTEVRAAVMSSECKISQSLKIKPFKTSSINKGNVDALDVCYKSLASTYLKEKEKCEILSDQYVQYVFNKCSKDLAPFNSKKVDKLKTLSEIL